MSSKKKCDEEKMAKKDKEKRNLQTSGNAIQRSHTPRLLQLQRPDQALLLPLRPARSFVAPAQLEPRFSDVPPVRLGQRIQQSFGERQLLRSGQVEAGEDDERWSVIDGEGK